MERDRNKIVILGSGNVATHLAKSLDNTNDIVQIWSRSQINADTLSQKLKKAQGVSNLEALDKTADFYIIAVTDDALQHVSPHLKGLNGIVAHTSGSFSLDNLKVLLESDRCGVFYPLQTFSKDFDLDLRKVPFLIEGGTHQVNIELTSLASDISEIVINADSELRTHLHLAAVFVNNFTNYLWTVASDYLKENTELSLNIFEPLMQETLRKALAMGPENAQTGPARRGDKKTITKHLELLEGKKANIYRDLTEHIIRRFSKK